MGFLDSGASGGCSGESGGRLVPALDGWCFFACRSRLVLVWYLLSQDWQM